MSSVIGDNMKIAIFGMPQSGKKTLFTLIAGKKLTENELSANAAVEGIAEIIDPRFEKLVALYNPESVARARINVTLLPKIEKGFSSNSEFINELDKYALRECHGFMPWQDHKELHETIGTYKESGGTIPSASYALSSTTAADRRPNIDQTLIADEDLTTTLPALTSETYTQYNLTGASVGAYTLTAADIVPLLANNPYYNTFSTPNWGQTLMPANSVATVWIYALPVTSSANSQAYRYLFVQPQWITQATSSSAGALTTAVNTEALRLPSELNLGTLTVQSPELVCIGKIIIDYTSSNWRLREVTLLTGNKYSQIGSPSGNYLSTVATDTSLTGDGTGASPLKVSISQVVLASQVFN